TLHSLYLVSPDPAVTISGLPGPCSHYIWSPRTLQSLYLVPHRPCIHYICSPTVHTTWKSNYFSKYKLLNTFSHQQLEQSCDLYQCPEEHMLKHVGEVFFLL
ncbi:unnamed protein product, partial [Staurois parvus]